MKRKLETGNGKSETKQLLPCPFCGSRAALKTYFTGAYGATCCQADCGAMLLAGSRAVAVRGWNLRAEVAALLAPSSATSASSVVKNKQGIAR